MKNKILYLESEENKYPICFNLNVMEEIQEEYGSMSAWGQLVEGEGEPKIKDLKAGLMAMINEAIDIENENCEIKRSPLTSKQVGRLIGDIGFDVVTTTIKELTIDSTKSDSDSKNE